MHGLVHIKILLIDLQGDNLLWLRDVKFPWKTRRVSKRSVFLGLALKVNTKAMIPECPQLIPKCPQLIPKCPQLIPKCPQLIPKCPQSIPKFPQFIPKCLLMWLRGVCCWRHSRVGQLVKMLLQLLIRFINSSNLIIVKIVNL